MKKLTALSAILCSLLFSACNAGAAKVEKTPEPTTEEQKTAYAIGVLLSESLNTFNLTPEELAQVQKGITDGVTHAKVTVNAQDYVPKIQALQATRLKAVSDAYLAKAEKEPGATKT